MEQSNNQNNNIKNILSIGNNILKQSNINGAKIGIYKNDLFVGMNDKQKKSLRIKLRNKLQSYVETLSYYHEQKNVEQCKKTSNFFIEFAKNVYNDARILFENNTNETKQQNIVMFQKLVETYTNTSKEQKK